MHLRTQMKAMWISITSPYHYGPTTSRMMKVKKGYYRDQTFFNFRVSNFLLSFLDVYCYSSFAVVVVLLCSNPLFQLLT